MISESYIYKNELLKIARVLDKRSRQKRWTDRSYLLTEKDLFHAFLIIRKLCETPKVTDQIRNKSYPITSYRIDAPFDVNWSTEHKIISHIDFENPKEGSLSIAHICNQFIHSFHLHLVRFDNGGLYEILVSSDRYKSKEIHGIKNEVLIDIFTEFGNNDPVKIVTERQPGTGKIIFCTVE